MKRTLINPVQCLGTARILKNERKIMKVIFAGESWIVQETHFKGFDTATLNRYEDFFADAFFDVLKKNNVELDYYPNHLAQMEFPDNVEDLKPYDVVILSDCGSNTLLLHPDMQFKGVKKGNRLLAIKDFVDQGGSLLMCGGYLSFAGIENKALCCNTACGVLPVEMMNYDDRMEHPEGVTPVVSTVITLFLMD